jgi:pimeloyl-ACP methyl ester carboxylesterase
VKTHRVPVGDYHLNVYEDGNGPPLLFAHSLTFDSSMWAHQVAALSSRYRVLRVDLPGHGGSGHPLCDYALEQMASDLIAVLDHFGIDQCGYVGHSMGGMVGMRLALAHPDRVHRLALLNTSANEQEEPLRSLFHEVNENSRGLMFSEGFRATNPTVVAPYRKRLAEPPEGDGIYFAAKAVIWRTTVLDGLNKLAVPTLVMTSDIDTSVPASHSRDIAERIPGAELIELSGSGHLTPVERSEVVSSALAQHFGGA